MKAFDETYADPEFQRRFSAARDGWMANLQRPQQADLDVAAFRGSLLSRILRALTGQRR